MLFGGAHSVVCVCSYCDSLVARADSQVESLGKVPDLVAIDTRLALGDTGRMQTLTFQVLGRLQLHQGVASWNEWYVAWSDGSFGWLAEAAGRVIVSRLLQQPVALPMFEQLQPGQRLELEGAGSLVIEEVGEAQIISAQGELPFVPDLRSARRFVDGSLSGGLYATLEYADSGQACEVFVGRELSYEAAGLTASGVERSWQAKQTSGVALTCPGCAAPISLKLSSSVAVVCPHCNKLWTHEHGKLALVASIKARQNPALPLGARGQLFGRELEVIGWTRRGLTHASTEYTWDEYLLHGSNGYSWLSENNGHWVHFTPLPAAEVSTHGQIFASYAHERYAHFQFSNDVRYVEVQGEFYWELRPDHRAQLDDYVRPPYQLSVEHTQKEKIWTRGQYVAADSLWQSFGQTTSPPAQRGVGPCQPNPYAAKLRGQLLGLGYGCALLVLFTLALLVAHPRRVCLVHYVAQDQAVSLSEPFALGPGMQAVAIRAHAEFEAGNGGVGLDFSLIQEQTGQSEDFNLELSYFTGFDDEGRWTEDDRSAEQRVGSIAAGRYLLRVEPHVDPAHGRPSVIRIEVTQGAFLWLPLWLCVLALTLPPLAFWILKARFERRRWSESDHSGGASDTEDDDS